MTIRAKQTVIVGAIVLILAAIAGLSAIKRAPEPVEVEALQDDDSAGDDDSGRFGMLPLAPKETK